MKSKFLLMITKVKNESDIIESFIRYHICIFDKIVVIDNGSIDGTYEILCELKKEGLNIDIINEAANDFDAFRFANQYNKKYLDQTQANFVIFMDADEFLISNDNRTPRDIMEKLDENTVYYIHWKTYLYEREEKEKNFVPLNFSAYREESKEQYTKILVPGQLLLKEKIIVTEGNHDIICERKLEKKFLSDLKFAHFPVRSKVQYVKQILLNVIGMMAIPDEKQQTGSHWKKMYQINTSDIDLKQESFHYAFYEEGKTYMGGIPDTFNIESKIKYHSLLNNNLEHLLLIHAEIQALRLKAERIKENRKNSGCVKEKILVYGTGGLCERRIDRILDNYEISAFVDGNLEKQFLTYRNKIVIAPEKMRFFPFSKIVIASEIYAEEIRANILHLLPMVSDTNIINIEQFIVDMFQK